VKFVLTLTLMKNHKKTTKLKNRGVALAIAMVMLTVLILIVTAFFQAYRAHFSLTRSTAASEVAMAGCESVFDYVTYRLEHDRNWGADDFGAASIVKDPAINDQITFKSEAGTHNFSGSIAGTSTTFEGTIYNNLTNNLAGVAGVDVLALAPPSTAYCEIACKTRESTKRATFLVRVAPLFDSSVLSRADIRIGAEKLTMRSNDKNRNLLRAEGDIYVPDMLTAERTKFYQPDSDTPDKNGMLWAKGDIYSYLTGAPGAEQLDTAQEIADAGQSTNGKMVQGAESHFSIFEMKKEQIKVPDTQAEVVVPPGRWNFVRRKADVSYAATYAGGKKGDKESSDESGTVTAWVDIVEYYKDPEAPIPTEVYRAADRVEDIITQIPASIKVGKKGDKKDTLGLQTDTVQTTAVAIPGYPKVNVLDSNELVYKSADGAANLTFDLQNQEVTATHNALITADGQFQLTSETDGLAPDETPPPVLNLGYETDGSKDGGVSKAVIKAKETINIENGVTVGLGALISEGGDVKVQPKNSNEVTIDSGLEGSGLLIFAGGDVVLSNPNDTSNWNFKGLVYALGGIKMEGNGAESATFLGTIVARQEMAPGDGPNGIEFTDCGNIEFVYDSKMLDAYVRELDNDRIQVETIFWRD
jgi:hypothetical protein